jgi:diguanylate cyclase (GGDEF)-like protein/PAS domain S-box-containing protein
MPFRSDPFASLPSWHPLRWARTLKARLAAGTLAALLIGLAVTDRHQAWVAERELLAATQQSEHAEAQRTAAVIGRRVGEMQRALRIAAAQLEPEAFDDARALREFFERQQILRGMFATVFAATPDGRMRLWADAAGLHHPAVSLADREYFKRTLAERRATVSEPVTGRVSAEPVVVFSQPRLDEHEQVVGVIGGALRLASRDLLSDLAEYRDDGHAHIVVTDRDGRILAHPQRARLLEPLTNEPRLAEAARQWAAEGRPLIRAAGHWKQDDQVVAMAGEATTQWLVWRATPKRELLLPLEDARQRTLWVAGAITLATVALLAAFVAWQMQPLLRLERRALAALAGSDDALPWPQAAGEIGQLARTLEHVWSERAIAAARGAEVQRRLGSVMVAAPVGIAFTRHQRFELMSDQGLRLFGYREDEIIGHPGRKIYASNEDYRALGPKVAAAFADGGQYVGEWQMLRADGTVFWARLHGRPVDVHDAGAGTVWTFYDIDAEVQARRRLEHAASHDPLTGLANRESFERGLARVLDARAAGPPASLLMIDLDHFKPVNDTAGHAAGDAMLKAVSAVIGAQLRASDLVGRLGGDEFGVLLGGCDQARAAEIAAKIHEAVAGFGLQWQGRTLHVGASVGVCQLGSEHATVAAWMAAADAACYAAKQAGRGTLRVAARSEAAREPG